ncbi:MAG: flagellar filament capping protein FliD [bacterium]
MGIDIFTQGNSSIEQLIQATLQIESQPRFRLEDKKDTLSTRNQVLSDLDSKLSSLNSLAKRLTDVLTDYFATKTVSTSDKDKITATASSTALAGSHDVSVSRLASSDTRVSKQYTKTGTELQTFFSTNGSQTFQIEVGHPTTSDSTNRETISVTINSSSTNNDDILSDIALAINNAMSTAVTAKTIDADEKLTASVVHEQDSTTRLVFKSGQSGYTYRMVMTDSANSLLSTTEISNSVQSSGTSGGYITSVGTSSSNSTLNSQLVVDGLTFYRDSNTINDILTGVTMTLKDVTTTTESLQVSVDTESVTKELQDLLDAYNDVITYLREKQAVDPDNNTRGVLAGESTYSYLRSNLRSIMTSKVSGISSGNPEHLFEIGITAASDGTLSFTDSTKFESALAAGSSQVSDLFNSTSGIAVQIKNFLNDFIKVGGVLDDSQDSISDRMTSIDTQLARFDERLARREAQLRRQLSKMQETAQLIGGQQAAFSSLSSSLRL